MKSATLPLLLGATLLLALTAHEAGAAPVMRSGSPMRPPIHFSPSLIDNTTHMDVNRLDMIVTNHASFAFDVTVTNAGLHYPKGSPNTAMFAAGIWLGAKVDGQVRVAVADYGQEFVPGPMSGGTFQPDIPRFRNYQLLRGADGNVDTTTTDYAQWPTADGAPLDTDGKPLLIGDRTVWSVFNDANPAAHAGTSGGTAPLGVEVQQTTFAFNRRGPLQNIIFVTFKIINKGATNLDSMYVSVWSDPDLGGFTDDLVGCDTTLSLGYCYNANNSDAQYGATPPAVGLDFFRGPIVQAFPGVFDTLGMTSFNKYINGTDANSPAHTYNYMSGLNRDGTQIHEFDNPEAPVTTFQVSGDPVAGTGWLDTIPADRRMLLTTGPFNMAVGDTQEVAAAVIIGQGGDRLSSVSDLKSKDQVAQLAFDSNFTRLPPAGANQAPTLAQPDNMFVGENATADQPINGYDLDYEPLIFSKLSGPSFMTVTTMDPGTGTATGSIHLAPGFDDAGTYAATVRVTDGTDNYDRSFTIDVANLNRPPTLDTVAHMTVNEGTTADQIITGSDPDGDPLTFQKYSGPSFLTVTTTNATTGNIHLAPATGDAGTYSSTISAVDPSNASMNQGVQITVNPGANQAPVMEQPSDMTVNEGATADQVLNAADPDGDPLSFSKASGPSFATVSTTSAGTGVATGNVHLAPGFSDAGTYSVTVRVGDASLSDSKALTITVNAASPTDRPPVLDAITDMTVTSGDSANQGIGATDPDGDAIAFTFTGPEWMTVESYTQSGNTRPGNIHLQAPGGTSGTFAASVTATANGASGTENFTITAVPSPPVVTAPEVANVEEEGTLTVDVTASDPDGDLIAFLYADLTALPGGNDAVFTTNVTNTQGQLIWHPVNGDAGNYTVRFIAGAGTDTTTATTSIHVVIAGAQAVGEFKWTPALSDTGTFTVTFTVADGDSEVSTAQTVITVVPAPSARFATRAGASPDRVQRGPIISVVGSVTVTAGEPLSITVSALDPDRGPIISVGADVGGLPTTNPPTFTTSLDPVVTAPPTAEARGGEPIEFQVTAGDPDGEPLLSFAADLSTLPQGAFAAFTTSPDNTAGVFNWVPQPNDARDLPYHVVFTASNALVASAATDITVHAGNRAPIASAGGPYAGMTNMAISFDGTGSSDPDGDALQYLWSFGDGMTAVGAAPMHTYRSAGDFTAVLTVTELRPQGPLSGGDSASVHVQDLLSARAFSTKVIRLKSQKPENCVQLEPVDNGFALTDINLPSIRLRSQGTGSVNEIAPVGKKSGILLDTDLNGVLDLAVCFVKTDLRNLFSLVSGEHQISAEITGQLTSGGAFSATVVLDVIGGTGKLAALLAPNPFNPSAVLTFELTRGGVVKLHIFDVTGRLVRDLVPSEYFGPGYHSIAIDARGRGGQTLSSGVYFYRLAAPEGTLVGRFVILE